MKHLSRIVAAICTIALACCTIACGGSTDTSSGNRLTIAWWGSQGRNEKQKQVNDLFLAQNKGASIDGQFSQYGDYWQKLATAAAGHQLPDIIAMDFPYMNQYISNDLIIDLSPYLGNTIRTEQIAQDVLNTGKGEDGNIYALSSGVNAPAVIYDKTLLNSMGIKVSNNWTIDDFIDICRKVDTQQGVKTNAGYYRDANVLEYYLRAKDISLYSDGQLGVSDPAELEPYFGVFQKGVEEGWHLDPKLFTEINLSVMNQDPLVAYSDNAHRSWCAFGWSNSLGGMQSLVSNGDDLALAPWPSTDVTKSNYIHPGQYFAITRDCENPKLAAKWIDFYINNQQANKIMGVDRGMPINQSMVTTIWDDLSDDDKESIDYVNKVVMQASEPINAPSPAKAVKINSAIMPTLQEEILYHRINAADASRMFISQASSALNQ